MAQSGPTLAKSWPYRRHASFERQLRDTATAYFRSRQYPVHRRFPYLLADWAQWPRNIVLPEVAEYVIRVQAERQAQHRTFPLHKYLHHGLSSQAMLFNLVGPLVVRADLEPLRRVVEAKGAGWPESEALAEFEIEDRRAFHEDYGQPTSIDLAIQGHHGPSLYIEAKLVEPEFGGCSVFAQGGCEGRNPAEDLSRCYLHHVGRTYWTRMQEHGLLEAWQASPICPFTSYYQFYREVLFALHQGGVYVLLHDARNPTFDCDGPHGRRGLFPFLHTMLPEAVKARVLPVSIQELLAAICATGRHEDWANEFASKYGMLSG